MPLLMHHGKCHHRERGSLRRKRIQLYCHALGIMSDSRMQIIESRRDWGRVIMRKGSHSSIQHRSTSGAQVCLGHHKRPLMREHNASVCFKGAATTKISTYTSNLRAIPVSLPSIVTRDHPRIVCNERRMSKRRQWWTSHMICPT